MVVSSERYRRLSLASTKSKRSAARFDEFCKRECAGCVNSSVDFTKPTVVRCHVMAGYVKCKGRCRSFKISPARKENLLNLIHQINEAGDNKEHKRVILKARKVFRGEFNELS